MTVEELVAYYNTITNNISTLSQDVMSFAEGVNQTLIDNFTFPEEDDQISWYEHFSDTLNELKNLPWMDQDLPDFKTQTEDYKSMITSLRQAIDTLFDSISSQLPDIPSIESSGSYNIDTDINSPSYPDVSLLNIPSLPSILEIAVPIISSFEEKQVSKERYSIQELLQYITSMFEVVQGYLNDMSQSIEVSTDFDFNFSSIPFMKDLSRWEETKGILTPFLKEINLSQIENVFRGESLDSYVFSEEFVKALADFSDQIVRVAPISYLKTLKMERELDAIMGDSWNRGFSDDVMDGRTFYDITVHRIQNEAELAQQKTKILRTYGERVWKMVENKTELYKALSSYILVSYYSLVDMTTRLYNFQIKQIGERLNAVDKTIRLNLEKLRTAIGLAKTELTACKAYIQQWISNQAFSLEKQILDKETFILELKHIQEKMRLFVQDIRRLSGKLNQDLLNVRLYQLKGAVLQQQARFESIKNDQVLLESKNDVLASMQDFIGMNLLESKLGFINNSQRAKLQILQLYVNYLESILRKYKFSQPYSDLLTQISNLKAQLSKFAVEAEGEQRIRGTWLSLLGNRIESESYDYRLMMRKILYDTERAFDLALMHLHNRLSKESTKYNTLGDYYEKQIRGVLSSAHTIVSITNRIMEEQ